MTQKEEMLTVAKSTIIFKTTDEWFKTLVSGVVETFFPDKEMTFSIEIKKRKGPALGVCCWGNPRHIEINSRYMGNGKILDNGIELAALIAHEIVHVFAKGCHGLDFQKNAANIGLCWDEMFTAGHTYPTREFAERIAPVLEQLEKTGLKVFPLKEALKEYSDEFILVKSGVNKWMPYYD